MADECLQQERRVAASGGSGRNFEREGGAVGPGFLNWSLGLHLRGKSHQGFTAEIFSLQSLRP